MQLCHCLHHYREFAPTSEVYLSVVSAEKPPMDSSLCLSHEAVSVGKGGSSL